MAFLGTPATRYVQYVAFTEQNMCPIFLRTPATPYVQHLYFLMCTQVTEYVPNLPAHTCHTICPTFVIFDVYPGISSAEHF